MRELLVDIVATAIVRRERKEERRVVRRSDADGGRTGKEGGARGGRDEKSGVASQLLAALPSLSPSAITSEASQIAYWLLGADEYAIGRGRVAQEAFLLETLQEEDARSSSGDADFDRGHADGKEGQQNNAFRDEFRDGSDDNNAFPLRQHPQFTAFRTIGDGFEFVLPPLTADTIRLQAVRGPMEAEVAALQKRGRRRRRGKTVPMGGKGRDVADGADSWSDADADATAAEIKDDSSLAALIASDPSRFGSLLPQYAHFFTTTTSVVASPTTSKVKDSAESSAERGTRIMLHPNVPMLRALRHIYDSYAYIPFTLVDRSLRGVFGGGGGSKYTSGAAGNSAVGGYSVVSAVEKIYYNLTSPRRYGTHAPFEHRLHLQRYEVGRIPIPTPEVLAEVVYAPVRVSTFTFDNNPPLLLPPSPSSVNGRGGEGDNVGSISSSSTASLLVPPAFELWMQPIDKAHQGQGERSDGSDGNSPMRTAVTSASWFIPVSLVPPPPPNCLVHDNPLSSMAQCGGLSQRARVVRTQATTSSPSSTFSFSINFFDRGAEGLTSWIADDQGADDRSGVGPLPLPFGSTRAEGRHLLEAWYDAKWRLMALQSHRRRHRAVHRSDDDVGVGVVGSKYRTVPSPHHRSHDRQKHCAPLSLTRPKCFALPILEDSVVYFSSPASPLFAHRQLHVSSSSQLPRDQGTVTPNTTTTAKLTALPHQNTTSFSSSSSSFSEVPTANKARNSKTADNKEHPIAKYHSFSSRSGKDAYIQALSGDDNRWRQVPIVFEAEAGDGDGREDGVGDGVIAVDADGRHVPLTSEALSSPSPSSSSLPLALATLISAIHNERRATMMKTLRTNRGFAVDSRSNNSTVTTTTTASPPPSSFSSSSRRLLNVVNDKRLYQPYLDPRSPHYKRILCVTYTHHEQILRATALHEQGAHLCDKHLLFTDKAVDEEAHAEGEGGKRGGGGELLKLLNRGRRVVIALDTPGGESYFNMWQKTRLILSKIEMLMAGMEASVPGEGVNNEHMSSAIHNTSHFLHGRAKFLDRLRFKRPCEGASSLALSAATSASDDVKASTSLGGDHDFILRSNEIAAQLLPLFASYDYVFVSGDDVCIAIPKLRRYLADVSELFGVSVPNRFSYRFRNSNNNENHPVRGNTKNTRSHGDGDTASSPHMAFLFKRAAATANEVDALMSSGDAPPFSTLHSKRILFPSSSSPSSASTPFFRDLHSHHYTQLVPLQFGYSNRKFISGASYILSRLGYRHFMTSSYETCEIKRRTFAEDSVMGECNARSGLVSRNAAMFGLNEEVMSCVAIDYVTGGVSDVHHTPRIAEYKRRVMPRGGPVTSKDSVQHHFCSAAEMRRQNRDLFGVDPRLSYLWGGGGEGGGE